MLVNAIKSREREVTRPGGLLAMRRLHSCFSPSSTVSPVQSENESKRISFTHDSISTKLLFFSFLFHRDRNGYPFFIDDTYDTYDI